MVHVVVAGGGWSGCSAAFAASKAGAKTTLLEKTDMLLGTGLVGGIMRNNGRYSAAEEIRALGGHEIFDIIDSVTRHSNINFPGHRHASLYDVLRIEPLIKEALIGAGVDVRLQTRVIDVEVNKRKIKSLIVSDDERIKGDAFVDATGTAGPMRKCIKVNGSCVMCILRCPTFGPRVSVAGMANVSEKTDIPSEAISGSCKLEKSSLGKWLIEKLERNGVVIVPIPKYISDEDKLSIKACQQYAIPDYAKNLILLDTGHVKVMTPFFPLEKLKQIPGFGGAIYADPYSGGRGNSVRYSILTPRDNTLKVDGILNLFCAGEKAGLVVGHTEAIATGLLSGYNSVRYAMGTQPIELPTSLAVGDLIAYVGRKLSSNSGLMSKYTFSGAEYFERMKSLGLYTTDTSKIRNRVKSEGLWKVFLKSLS